MQTKFVPVIHWCSTTRNVIPTRDPHVRAGLLAGRNERLRMTVERMEFRKATDTSSPNSTLHLCCESSVMSMADWLAEAQLSPQVFPQPPMTILSSVSDEDQLYYSLYIPSFESRSNWRSSTLRRPNSPPFTLAMKWLFWPTQTMRQASFRL